MRNFHFLYVIKRFINCLTLGNKRNQEIEEHFHINLTVFKQIIGRKDINGVPRAKHDLNNVLMKREKINYFI